ncbi:MAG: hypothetical protein IKQ09_09355 [Bacteroidales bacterium]|nr:hypothetical protein [Bacteroidales bacterium]
MITLKEYIKQTKTTSKYCFRISGIIFSVIFCFLYRLTYAPIDSFPKILLMLVICVLLGNAFAGFILCCAILSSYSKIKRSLKLIEELPKDVIIKYEIYFVFKKKNLKYNYPDGEIYGHKDNDFFQIKTNESHVFVTYVFMSNALWQKKPKLDRKYRKEKITLFGDGLTQKIRRKEWRHITPSDFDRIIQHLIEIAKTESYESNLIK